MAEDKPNRVYPSSPTSSASPMPLYIPDPSLRGESFDQILKNRGIRFIHRKATPCSNMSSLDDNNHVPDCPICDDSGWIYYAETEIYGVFQSNSIEKTFEQQGIWEMGSAVVTLPSVYADGSVADFNSFDQLTIPDFEVRLWELKEYEHTVDNKQYLRYPIVKIEFIASVRNDVLVNFTEGVDFNISTDGAIEWLPGRVPKINPGTDRGEVLTISYFAHPIYKVLQPLRELRISQEQVAGVKYAKRLPQQVLVKRDFLVSGPEKTPATGFNSNDTTR
jgi:hypothetical protein